MNDMNSGAIGIPPRLIERAGGGWLAVTPYNAKLCFGVTAQTESQAREEFLLTLERWEETLAADRD